MFSTHARSHLWCRAGVHISTSSLFDIRLLSLFGFICLFFKVWMPLGRLCSSPEALWLAYLFIPQIFTEYILCSKIDRESKGFGVWWTQVEMPAATDFTFLSFNFQFLPRSYSLIPGPLSPFSFFYRGPWDHPYHGTNWGSECFSDFPKVRHQSYRSRARIKSQLSWVPWRLFLIARSIVGPWEPRQVLHCPAVKEGLAIPSPTCNFTHWQGMIHYVGKNESHW